jgi:hypothetical protein
VRKDRPEVADIFRTHEERFLDRYSTSAEQRKVLRDLTACRTAALGGHVRQCDECQHLEISYNSCRNRHCPKCQRQNNAQWLEAQAQNLLEVAYFHVVFTLPEGLGPMALQNQKIVYAMLFRAASETLLTIARDPKHLGAQIGFVAILHTWGQTLQHSSRACFEKSFFTICEKPIDWENSPGTANSSTSLSPTSGTLISRSSRRAIGCSTRNLPLEVLSKC